MKKVFVIDNYDSFTYNLVHYLEDLECSVTVKQNDEFQMEEIEYYDALVLSPGPGIPKDAGELMAAINHFAPTKKILGVCLGLQAIVESFGGVIDNLDRVFHGVSTDVKVIGDDVLFRHMPKSFPVGRYHSWIAAQPLPNNLIKIAVDNDNLIMAIRHKTYDVCGVQFHPESIMTTYGKQLLKNWIEN